MRGVSTPTVCCQKVPPTTVNCPGSTWPMPTRLNCVSAPPTTTGVPSFKPVSMAACRCNLPSIVPGSYTGGKTEGLNPHICTTSPTPVPRPRSHIPDLDPTDYAV